MDRVASALGKRYAGRFDECREHSPLESVIACLGAVRRASPDLLVTIGGGSVIDTAKIVQLGLTHGIHTLDELLERANKPTPGPSKIRQLIVPTTHPVGFRIHKQRRKPRQAKKVEGRIFDRRHMRSHHRVGSRTVAAYSRKTLVFDCGTIY
jgi:hypothetical protein